MVYFVVFWWVHFFGWLFGQLAFSFFSFCFPFLCPGFHWSSLRLQGYGAIELLRESRTDIPFMGCSAGVYALVSCTRALSPPPVTLVASDIYFLERELIYLIFVFRISYCIFRTSDFIRRISHFVLRTSYFVLRTSYFVFHTSYAVFRISYFILCISYFV